MESLRGKKMNGKKARKLRKQLGMTKENLRSPEYGSIKSVKKTVFFRNKIGGITPQETTRQVLVNKSKYVYRKVKKQLSKG
jgi:NACalpha-BTF3-like transcription factor